MKSKAFFTIVYRLVFSGYISQQKSFPDLVINFL
jgi:hypothetical protein